MDELLAKFNGNKELVKRSPAYRSQELLAEAQGILTAKQAQWEQTMEKKEELASRLAAVTEQF